MATALAAAGLAGFAVGGVAEVDQTDSIVVPIGNLGDEVSYLTTWSGASTSSADAWGFRINRTDVTVDGAGRPRAVLAVDWDPGADCREFAYPGSDDRLCYGLANSFVDLGQRTTIRFDEWGKATNAAYMWYEQYSNYGPFFHSFDFHQHGLPGALVQGRSLGVGDDLTAALENPFRLEWGLRDSWISGWEFGSTVARRGFVGEEKAIEIEVRGALRLRSEAFPNQQAEASMVAPPDEWMFLHVDIPRDTLVRFEERLWFVENSPYPVSVDSRMEWGSQLTQVRSELASVVSGASPIPWGSDPGHAFEYANRYSERSSRETLGLAQGNRSALPYSLEQALRAVSNDITLARFTAWKQVRPDFRLIGAHFHGGSSAGTPGPLIWQLIFGEPDATDGIVVRSTHRLGLVKNDEAVVALVPPCSWATFREVR